MSKVAWGIIGAGSIAKAFAVGVKSSKTGELVAVGSRDKAKSESFGAGYGVDPARCHGSYDALLADRAVQAVYVATPHPFHAEWVIKAAQAGKHFDPKIAQAFLRLRPRIEAEIRAGTHPAVPLPHSEPGRKDAVDAASSVA